MLHLCKIYWYDYYDGKITMVVKYQIIDVVLKTR